MGTSNQPPLVSPGAREFELDNREGQINFTFKVMLRPYISRIRMFGIEILLLGVLFGTILGPTLLFSGPLLYFSGKKVLKNRNSSKFVVSVFIDFPSNLQWTSCLIT